MEELVQIQEQNLCTPLEFVDVFAFRLGLSCCSQTIACAKKCNSQPYIGTSHNKSKSPFAFTLPQVRIRNTQGRGLQLNTGPDSTTMRSHHHWQALYPSL